MKRIATATALVTALAAVSSAGSLPKPISMVKKMKEFNLTHFVRGDGHERGGSSGGYSEPAEAEARKANPQQPKTAKGAKPKPQPATAD